MMCFVPRMQFLVDAGFVVVRRCANCARADEAGKCQFNWLSLFNV